MEISVAEAAELLGVHPTRVRILLRSGDLPGRLVGRQWLVDADGVSLRASSPSAPGRPFAPWRAWALLAALEAASGAWSREGGPLVRSSSSSRVPVSKLLAYLRSGELVDAPASRWRDLLGARASVFDVHGHPAAIQRLRTSAEVLAAGPRAAVQRGANLVVADDDVELYLSGAALQSLSAELFLQARPLASGMVALTRLADRSGGSARGAEQGPLRGPGRALVRVPVGDPWPGSASLFPLPGWSADAAFPPPRAAAHPAGALPAGALPAGALPAGAPAPPAAAAAGRVWISALAADLLDSGDVRSREAGREMLSLMAQDAVEVLREGPRGVLSWVVESRPRAEQQNPPRNPPPNRPQAAPRPGGRS